jgi:hypothetical protein|tara:strand:+ start:261 stop:449 length:189 start_codon:yes stop_codon:yes gene_type:complete
MTNNKQLTKGNKMRKIAIVIGILSVLATSAQAGYWTHNYNSWSNSYTSTYTPSFNSLMGGWY